MIEELDYRPIQ